MKLYLGIFWRKYPNQYFYTFLNCYVCTCVYQHTVTQLPVDHRGNDFIKISSHTQKYNNYLGIATGCPVLHHNDLAQRITLQFFMYVTKISYCTS